MLADIGSVSPVEFIWTVISFAGIYGAVVNLRGASKDLLTARVERLDGLGEIIYGGQVSASKADLVCLTFLALVGIGSMFIPAFDQGALPLKYRIYGYALLVMFLGFAVLFDFRVYLVWRTRQRIQAWSNRVDNGGK